MKITNMIGRLTLLLIFLAAGNFLAAAQSEFPYEKYKSRTLYEVTEISSVLPATKDDSGKPIPIPDLLFSADFLYSNARVQFLNRSRPLSKESIERLGQWQKSFQLDPNTVSLFENEYLFKECGVEYWLPVQKQVAAYFTKELVEGDWVTIYLMRSVGTKSKDQKSIKWIFLVSEFTK